MAKSNKVLSIDITNESITIIEISASQKKQTNIHRVLMFETPEDSYEDGIIRDQGRIAGEIRSQLSQAGITNKNAIFVMNSTKIVNREVEIPQVKENKIAGIINANASEYFPVNVEDYVVAHSLLETITDAEGNKKMRVMAVAAPSNMVRSYYDLGAAAGLKVEALDYIGNSMLQLIKTQTTEQATTMVIQLGSESTVLNIVQGDKLLLQRTVPYGTNPVVNVVMEERGVDATTAMALLQNDRIITVDFDDNEATGAFRYLINNIGRVMDYYASKNPDSPIDDVFLTGDGALIKGIDGLFKIQLNVSTRVMDSLYNIKFDPGIDLKVYSPVYLIAPIGAAMDPMGFSLSKSGAKASTSSGISTVPFVIFVALCCIAVAAAWFLQNKKLKEKKDERADLEVKIKAAEEIEKIIAEHDAAKAKYLDVMTMSMMTRHKNEQALEFVNEVQKAQPTNVVINSYNSTDESIAIPGRASSYEDIEEFIMNLKKIECIDDVYVASIASATDEKTGASIYDFSLTCKFQELQLEDLVGEESEGADAPTEEPASESE
ncbi:pilus assembly protein PilM [Eubacterium ruminantium]|uniref:pilus assembly protein PilM n=1 Tax=Eubacterium ruminantium TaxID=42322 RepID=UPI001569150A|nr:pilus assembly protein PilM [Eubacterium ruminantium]